MANNEDTHLLLNDNDNEFSNKAQEIARGDAMPQCHKKQRYKVWNKFISKETEPFVDVPESKSFYANVVECTTFRGWFGGQSSSRL